MPRKFPSQIYTETHPQSNTMTFTASLTMIGALDTETGSSLGLQGPRTFSLLRLIPELRLLVYEPLIAIGHLSILRTNRQVHEEAATVMERNAVLRIKYGYRGRINLSGIPTLHCVRALQHIEVHFGMSSNYCFHQCWEAFTQFRKVFGGRDVARHSCTIFLDFSCYPWVTGQQTFARDTSCRAIARLTGFKTLTVKIKRDNYRAHKHEGKTFDRTLHIYNTIQEILETTLGPALLDKSISDHCLLFHPKRFHG